MHCIDFEVGAMDPVIPAPPQCCFPTRLHFHGRRHLEFLIPLLIGRKKPPYVLESHMYICIHICNLNKMLFHPKFVMFVLLRMRVVLFR